MRTRLWAKSRRLSAMKIIYVIIICGDLRRYVWRNNSIFPQFSTFKMVEESVAREDGATLRRNKVWYWACFVRPWSIGRTQYFLPSFIFSNFFFLLTYLISRTTASENWHSSRTIRSILLLKIASMRFAFRANLGAPAIHRRCAGDPLHEQVAEHFQLQTQVGRRHMRTKLKK